MMHTMDHIEKAREETKKALKYKSKARKVSLSYRPPAWRSQPLCQLTLFASASFFGFCHLLPL